MLNPNKVRSIHTEIFLPNTNPHMNRKELLEFTRTFILLLLYNCIPEKHPQRFSCINLQATFILGFLLNFASGLLWQRSGHPILLVAHESKLCSGESKTSKLLTIACLQAVGQFLSDLFYTVKLILRDRPF